MNIGIIFALFSMFFAGLNDIVFKRYSTVDRSRGIYIFGIGITWTILQLAYYGFKDIEFSLNMPTLIYGGISGILLVCSNILLLESLKRIDASLGSTTYRLNTIIVVLLSVILLNEGLYLTKIIGITFGIIAVILLFKSNSDTNSRINYSKFLWIAITASIFRAFYGVVSKIGLINNASPEIMLLFASCFWIIGGLLYAVLREKRFKITKIKIQYSIISGILVFLIVNTLLNALKVEQASIIIPIANLSFLITLTLSLLTKMEAVNKYKIIAIIVSVLAIIFLSVKI